MTHNRLHRQSQLDLNWRSKKQSQNTNPSIGNGDISAQKAKYLLDQTGVHALMIGQGAVSASRWLLGNENIFLKPVNCFQLQMWLKLSNFKGTGWVKFSNEKKRIYRNFNVAPAFQKYFPGLPNFRELKIKLLGAETEFANKQNINTIVEVSWYT